MMVGAPALPFCHVPWPVPPGLPRIRVETEERVVKWGVGRM